MKLNTIIRDVDDPWGPDQAQPVFIGASRMPLVEDGVIELSSSLFSPQPLRSEYFPTSWIWSCPCDLCWPVGWCEHRLAVYSRSLFVLFLITIHAVDSSVILEKLAARGPESPASLVWSSCPGPGSLWGTEGGVICYSALLGNWHDPGLQIRCSTGWYLLHLLGEERYQG